MLRTPATRCEPEFEKLFSIRYSQEPDGGLRVRPNKTQIQVRYTPASPALRERMHTLKGVPDITALSRPVDSLAKIAERCCDELDAYSRWLAKNPNSRGSLAAVSLLPAELVSTYDSEDIRALDSFISDRIAGSDNAIIAADELLFYWPVTNPLKVTKSEAVQLAQSCEKLGIGIEPDVRFGGPPPASGGSIVVFRRSQNAPAAPSPEYSAAVLLARLGVTVGSANGALATLEREELHRSVGDAFELAAAERRRLDAHIEWLIAAGPGTAGLKKQLAAMTADQRLRISAYVTRVAAADGVVDAAEMRALEKIYNSLGLSTDDLYRNMHATISGGETPTPAVTSKSSPFALDRGRLQIKLAETASVSSLLADVFADEDTAVPSAYASSAVVSATVLGSLDDAQSELLRELAHRSEWPRHEVEILASSHELLIDGALESINDYAFERAGEALWEGDDPITINEQVAKEILA